MGLITSCEDAIDIDQAGVITDDNVFENVEDLQRGLNLVYSAYNNFDAINFNAVFTDNIKNGSESAGQNKSLYNHVLNSSTSMTDGGTIGSTTIWGGRYTVINYANRVLEAYQKLTFDKPSDLSKAKVIAGQLYGIRAMCHLDLYQYFSESYTDNSKLSVPIMDFVPEDVHYEPTRNTVGEVYDFINSDLDKAEQDMGNADLGKEYLSKAAFEALRARLLLFHAGDDPTELQMAKDAANSVLATVPLVASTSQYVDIFTDQDDKGVVFKKRMTENNAQIAHLFYFNEVDPSPDPYVEMSNGLYNELSSNDVRRQVMVGPNSNFVGTDDPDNQLLIYKYPGSQRGAMINDLKLIRSAEMQLIVAEAEARMGQPGDAAATVQALVNVRYNSGTPTISYANKHDALIGILAQRRLELAYEGHRFLDLKRFRNVTNDGIVRNPVDCESFNASDCNLSKNDYRWIMPIPQGEINGNSIIQQNPGY